MAGSIASTLGVGSGIDTKSLVTDLVSAQRDAKDKVLAKRAETNQSRISALATATNGITNLTAALKTLVDGGSLYTQPTSTDAALVSVTAVPGARLGGLTGSITVQELAQAQVSVSSAISGGGAAPVGEGVLKLSVGGGAAVDIKVTAANNSLAGLAKAISASGQGVTASVVTNASGSQLVVRGQTGEAKAFTLTMDSGDAAGLGRFETPAMSATSTARDAELTLDGVAVKRASNSFSDLIDGVKIDLKGKTTNVVLLGAARPTEAIRQSVSDFVSAYNELETILDEATAVGASDGTGGGALRGEASIREMRRQLGKLVSTPLTAGGDGDGPRTLTEIGVGTNRDGSLKVDTAMLQKALADHPDAVEAMFNPGQRSDDPLVRITSAQGAAKPGTYKLENLVPGANGGSASGVIAGTAGLPVGTGLRAAGTSPAAGLVLAVDAPVASATVTVDLGLLGALSQIKEELTGKTGALTSASSRFGKETSAIGAAKTQLDTRSESYRAQLEKSFTAMDARVAVFKATQAYLEQQVAIWTKSN